MTKPRWRTIQTQWFVELGGLDGWIRVSDCTGPVVSEQHGWYSCAKKSIQSERPQR